MGKISRILVVDDEAEFCENVKDVLELEGYEVVTAYDGLQAIQMVKQNVPDMILMDINMPKMGGPEAFKKIREIVPRIPIAMMTAYSMDDAITDTLKGACGFLDKPLSFDRLFTIIEDCGQDQPPGRQ